MSSSARTAIRAEIQALRALALALVLAEHFRPGCIAAGFVGLDAFFAVSGFLITRLLLREIESSGSLSPARFWVRRARRLLPASLLVLLVCAIAARLLMLRSHQINAFTQVTWSALYAQNWFLAASLIDYWGPREPTPVLHFWSLSVEEQFYALWPPLMLAAVWLARRSGVSRRRALTAAMGTIGAASFAYGLAVRGSEAAYVSTTARAWEFAAGGLLALLDDVRDRPSLRAATSWAGLAALIGSAFLLPFESARPSVWTLVPVAGTLAVIWAGTPGTRWSPERLYALASVQAIGDLSYVLYLWHWPVVVFLASVLRTPQARVPLLPGLALALALAWTTKRYVEDPLRFGPGLARLSPASTLAASLAAMALVVATAQCLQNGLRREVAASLRSSLAITSAKPPCFGAAARDPDLQCREALSSAVVPRPIEPVYGPWEEYRPRRLEDGVEVAELGPGGSGPRPMGEPFALIGDSHAWMLRPAFDALAERAPGVALTGCAATVRARRPSCVAQNERRLAWLWRHPEIVTVYAASRARPRDGVRAEADAYLDEWRRLPPTVRRIVVIRDAPVCLNTDCVERALNDGLDPASCRDPRSLALPEDPALAAAARAGRRVQVLDLTDLICDAERCFHVVGGVRVFADADHLTPLFVRTLAPILLRRALELEGVSRPPATAKR